MSRSNQLAGLLTADPPSALDTINEINTALGNDAALSTTLTNSIATKASKSGDTFTGNVGIGGSPSTLLHLVSAQPELKIQSNGSSQTATISMVGSDGADAIINSTHSSGKLKLQTNSSDKLTIDHGGNVGIGTASPSKKLHLYNATGGTDLLRLEVADSDSAFIVFKNSAREWRMGEHSQEKFEIFDTTASATRFTIDTSGNVGIGTISPSGYGLSLERSGVSSSEIDISLTSGTSNKECIINFGNNLTNTDRYRGRIFYQTDNNVMGFWTNKTEKMRIESGGTVQITDPNSGSQQSTQDFKIGRATIQVGNVDTTSSTSYGAGFTFKTHDYNGSSFVNRDALRITAKGDIVVAHDNYKHGTAHDPNEQYHGTGLLKTNADFVQTGGDYDPRTGGVTQTIFTPYYRRAMISNAGNSSSSTHGMWYMWYKLTGVDGGYSGRSTPYIEMRVVGHSGHHSGCACRIIGINPASNNATLGSLGASQIGLSRSSYGYGSTLEVRLYGNNDSSQEMYFQVAQGMREGHVSIFADLYSCTRHSYSQNNFGIHYYGGGSSSSTTQPQNIGSLLHTFNN